MPREVGQGQHVSAQTQELTGLASLWREMRGGRSRVAVWGLLLALGVAEVGIFRTISNAIVDLHHGGTSLDWAVPFFLNVVLMFTLRTRWLRDAARSLGAVSSQRTLAIATRMQELDLGQFDAIGEATFTQRLIADNALVREQGPLLAWLALAIAVSVVSTAYAWFIAPMGMLLVLGFLITMGLLMAQTAKRVASEADTTQARAAEMRGRMHDLLAGYTQVRLHRGRSAAIARGFAEAVRRYVDQRKLVATIFFRNDGIYRAVAFVGVGVLGFGVAHVFPGLDPVVPQLLLLFLFLRRYVTWPFLLLPQVAEAAAALARIDQTLARLPKPGPRTVTQPRRFDVLSLEGVTYTYPEQQGRHGFTCGPVDFELRPGEVVFITGHNGSGKSTFIRLLTGLFRPQTGVLRLDGEPVTGDALTTWYPQFASVFSEFTLFDRLFGMSDVDPERVRTLIGEMELSHKVDYLDGTFRTAGLSTGQRKRLALVVAHLQGRPIFVFDEWAADQDPSFRAAFYEKIVPELRRRGDAVVAITHDDDYFHIADRRLHFEHGRAAWVT